MNSGDTAWVLVSAALVLFMTPGLAFFYGGMVRGKNVLGMLMQNFFCMGLISVVWVIVGFSLAFGKDAGGGVIGGLGLAGLKGLGTGTVPALGSLTVPALGFVAYQMMFALMTAGRISGGAAAGDVPTRRALIGTLAAWVCFRLVVSVAMGGGA